MLMPICGISAHTTLCSINPQYQSFLYNSIMLLLTLVLDWPSVVYLHPPRAWSLCGATNGFSLLQHKSCKLSTPGIRGVDMTISRCCHLVYTVCITQDVHNTSFNYFSLIMYTQLGLNLDNSMRQSCLQLGFFPAVWIFEHNVFIIKVVRVLTRLFSLYLPWFSLSVS